MKIPGIIYAIRIKANLKLFLFLSIKPDFTTEKKEKNPIRVVHIIVDKSLNVEIKPCERHQPFSLLSSIGKKTLILKNKLVAHSQTANSRTKDLIDFTKIKINKTKSKPAMLKEQSTLAKVLKNMICSFVKSLFNWIKVLFSESFLY